MPESLRPLMVLGCTSNAGKSFMVTALGAWFARQGIDVVPFKAQNMSNNARVVNGGEIGVAQWLQAKACGVEPTIDMNPVLVKPESNTSSQIVVNGQVDNAIGSLGWNERGPNLWPSMVEAFDRLRNNHQLVLLEGAGSPAEINLPDLVNNGMVKQADASALLVADIDRGGAFAHLFGTWSLVPQATRERLGGYILNRFRGDAGLLEPGPAQLTELTGMPHAGVVSMLEHSLPDEEGPTLRGLVHSVGPRVAIISYPFGSNLDEWTLLAENASVIWTRNAEELLGVDTVILPGSKNVSADLDWMRDRQLDRAIAAFHERGGRVIGVCGGAMMLGRRVHDGHGAEGEAAGLSMMDFVTEFSPNKTVRNMKLCFPSMFAPWEALSGLVVDGYEIRFGEVFNGGQSRQVADCLWVDGRVLATTVHGVFEDPGVIEAVFGVTPESKLQSTFALLADTVDEALDTELVWSLVES